MRPLLAKVRMWALVGLRDSCGSLMDCVMPFFFPGRCFDPTLICVLKIISRFVVCLHFTPDRFFVESCTFVHFSVQECKVFFWNFGRKLDNLLVLQAICRPRVSWFLSTSASWFTFSSEFTLLFLATESALLCFLVTIFSSDRRAFPSSEDFCHD